MLPLPSWPSSSKPQASTAPVEVTARLCPAPAATAVTFVPAGRSTFTGTSLSVVPPSPSSPSSFLPQLNTAPVEVTARLWAKPAAIPVTFVPPSGLTFTGTSLPFVLPLQSWPAMFQPQANTAPFELSARLWYKPPATAVTFTAEEAASAARIEALGGLPPRRRR